MSIRHEYKESGEITELKHMVEKAMKMIEDIRTDKKNVGSQSYCSYCHKENRVAADCWQKGNEQNRLSGGRKWIWSARHKIQCSGWPPRYSIQK